MNLVVDENVNQFLIEKLREAGHGVHSIRESSPSMKDNVILQLSLEKHALLLTQDRDFGELVFRLGQETAGVLYFRLPLPRIDVLNILLATLSEYDEGLLGKFTVVTPTDIRIRKV